MHPKTLRGPRAGIDRRIRLNARLRHSAAKRRRQITEGTNFRRNLDCAPKQSVSAVAVLASRGFTLVGRLMQEVDSPGRSLWIPFGVQDEFLAAPDSAEIYLIALDLPPIGGSMVVQWWPRWGQG